MTAILDKDGLRLLQGITRTARRTANGVQTWLGYPFVTRANAGTQNEGHRCDLIEVDPSLLDGKPLTIAGGDVQFQLSDCSLRKNANGLGITEAGDGNRDGFLVLLQVNPDVSTLAMARQYEFHNRDRQLAEGFAIDYCHVRFSRHPSRFTVSKTHERLLLLHEGETYRVDVIEPAVRILGLAVNDGRRLTYELSVVDGTVQFNQTSAQPLVIPTFDSNSLSTEVGAALMLIAFATMCGIVAAPGHHVTSVWAMAGAACGAVLFAALTAVRYVVAQFTRPKYSTTS